MTTVETSTQAHPSGDERFAVLDKKLKRVRYDQDQLIELLHTAQDVFGYLSPDVLWYLSTALQLPPSRVYGVAAFYHLFNLEPQGRHSCTVCTGTACYVKGADQLVERVGATYGIEPGSTSEDGMITLATARCLGSCGLAPLAVLDGEIVGRTEPDQLLAAIEERLAAEGGDA